MNSNKIIKKIIYNNKYYLYNNKNDTIIEWLLTNNIKYNIKNTFDVKQNIILVNNHVTHYNTVINNLYDKLNTDIITIELVGSIRGGGLVDMFSSIIQIGKVFLMLGDFVIWFGKFVAWFIFFLGWLFKFLFVDLPTDFYHSLVIIIVTIFKLPLELFSAIIAFGMNSIGGWMTTIWGWDQSNLTKNDKNSNYFKGIDRTKGKKCYLTNTNTVPFSILLGTILCPPLGVFMDLGISGWFNILICIILTLLFYVPGLFYALIVIYS